MIKNIRKHFYLTIEKLNKNNIQFEINKYRDYIMLKVQTNTRYWEIEYPLFPENDDINKIEVEVFEKNRNIFEKKKLKELFKKELSNKIDLFVLIKELEYEDIYYELKNYLNNSIILEVRTPNDYWNIEVTKNNSIKIEIFTNNTFIYGEEKLKELFNN